MKIIILIFPSVALLCLKIHILLSRNPCYHVSMIVSFKDKATEDIFDGANSKQARKACPQTLWRIASRKLDQLDSVNQLEELKIPPGNRLEALSGDRDGFYSIRINEQYRICFAWSDLGPSDVEITDYH
ncbi:MAG: type II toxin-antitoxin system RelE/ParE family toxin [Thiolinea sp.]